MAKGGLKVRRVENFTRPQGHQARRTQIWGQTFQPEVDRRPFLRMRSKNCPVLADYTIRLLKFHDQ